VNSRIWLAP